LIHAVVVVVGGGGGGGFVACHLLKIG